MENRAPDLEFHPVTPERWRDLDTLFGPQGAYSGCWCMWWRLKRSEPQKALSGYSGYTGIVSAFRKAGFVEVLRRSEHQPIMRYYIEGESGE